MFTPITFIALLGGSELHMVEDHQIDSEGTWRTATLLINCVDAPFVRSTFASMCRSLVGTQTSSQVYCHLNGIAQMCVDLRSQYFDAVAAVIYTAGSAEISVENIQRVTDTVLAMGAHMVVIVDDDCARWRTVRGVSGFVQGVKVTTPSTATSMVVTLAALTSPHTLLCADAEDIGNCLGSADQPATLVDCVWMRSAQKLEFTSTADRDVVRDAKCLAATLCAASLQIADCRSILQALRECSSSVDNVILQAPLDRLSHPWLHPNFVFLPLVCG